MEPRGRRIYDSPWWRWLVGPAAYVLAVVAVSITLFDREPGQAIAFAVAMAAFILVRSWLASRRESRQHSS